MKTLNPGLRSLTTAKERQEIRVVGRKPLKCPGLRLKRSFNQKWPDGSVTKYWRVVGPARCPSLDSDLSLEGLRRWGLL